MATNQKKKNQLKKLEDETIRCSIVVQNEPHARLTKCQEAFQRSGNPTEIFGNLTEYNCRLHPRPSKI